MVSRDAIFENWILNAGGGLSERATSSLMSTGDAMRIRAAWAKCDEAMVNGCPGPWKAHALAIAYAAAAAAAGVALLACSTAFFILGTGFVVAGP